jgi:RNA polymerase primary sigma factor
MASKNNTEIDECVKQYFKCLSNYKSLTKEEEHKLLYKYLKKGDVLARNKLIQSNLKYACSIANSFRGRGVDLSELISEANNGLIESIDKFSLKNDVKLITYAKWWIIQRIKNYIMLKNRLPSDELPTEHEEQIYNEDGVTEKIEKNTNEALIYENIDYDKNENYRKEYVNKILSILSQREREIVFLYYGLNGEPMTLEDIGDEYGLTKERIRQILETSIKKIRTEVLSEREIKLI